MATDPLDALRLTLMQEVLPLGMAVVERARRGGPQEVMAAFDGTDPDPLGRLRSEGEPAASQLRESLDRLQPGLGNPVVRVEVRDVPADPRDAEELREVLTRIGQRLDLLEQRLGLGAAPGNPGPGA